MERILKLIESSQAELNTRLEGLESRGGLTEDRYCRYLSMQYNLTKGVQRHFYRIAGNDNLANKKSLRQFLTNFADEEQPHFAIAEKDLKALGKTPDQASLDVELWWAYFDRVIDDRPYLRLGATCILENISASSGERIKQLMSDANYLSPKNTKFLVIHMHAELPHGDQIITALNSANLSDSDFNDLVEGAEKGKTMFLRMLDHAFEG